jgi:hypothetical protein
VIILSLFVKVLLWSWGFQVIAAGLLLLRFCVKAVLVRLAVKGQVEAVERRTVGGAVEELGLW